MKDSGSYANPINSSFQKFRTTRADGQFAVRSDNGFYTYAVVPARRNLDVYLQSPSASTPACGTSSRQCPKIPAHPSPTGYVNGGGKVDHMGGSIVGLRLS